jgi:hypothetical protein
MGIRKRLRRHTRKLKNWLKNRILRPSTNKPSKVLKIIHLNQKSRDWSKT